MAHVYEVRGLWRGRGSRGDRGGGLVRVVEEKELYRCVRQSRAHCKANDLDLGRINSNNNSRYITCTRDACMLCICVLYFTAL